MCHTILHSNRNCSSDLSDMAILLVSMATGYCENENQIWQRIVKAKNQGRQGIMKAEKLKIEGSEV